MKFDSIVSEKRFDFHFESKIFVSFVPLMVNQLFVPCIIRKKTMNQSHSMHEPIPDETEQLAKAVVNSAFQVHQKLGPGLLESAYETCLCYELAKQDIRFEKQKELPVIYDGQKLDAGFRIDILVFDSIVLELKVVEKLTSLHEAQLLTYLKLSGKRLGFLMNFNTVLFKNGLKRMIL